MRRISIAESKGNRKTFTIPIYPHVKKFILKNYGKYISGSGINTEEYTILGKIVTLSLRETRSRVKDNDQYRDRLTETICLVLTKEQTELSPRLHKLIRVNTDMDVIFKDHMLEWIQGQKVAGIPPYTACKMFLERYQIDDKEYSLDAAYRYWQRSQSA
jgi:hypothetical protein